ncbi:MAG: metallophosphoesterase family protein [Oscillospiraceae bacterium]|nr:metallophosphoesterase family protein [Oscillospiraceae bacterium]
MRYYISDLHFWHKNLISKMDKRPFETVEEMNEYMITQWNRKVRKNDEVVILGDLGFMKGEAANELLKRLNGKKFLIIGNHDHYFLDDKAFDRSLFGWIKDYAELNDNKRVVVLSHYPMMCYNGQYRKDPEGNPKRFMLYGHVHNTHDEQLINEFINITRKTILPDRAENEQHIPCNMINCFCMFSDYTPLTLDEWIKNDRERRHIYNKDRK